MLVTLSDVQGKQMKNGRVTVTFTAEHPDYQTMPSYLVTFQIYVFSKEAWEEMGLSWPLKEFIAACKTCPVPAGCWGLARPGAFTSGVPENYGAGKHHYEGHTSEFRDGKRKPHFIVIIADRPQYVRNGKLTPPHVYDGAMGLIEEE